MPDLDRHKPHVVLLATGGTISSRKQAAGGATTAADTGEQLLGSVRPTPSIPVRVIDVLRRGSYLLSFDDMLAICEEIRQALADPEVVGVVVAHGTDTMEETAYLADLLHDDHRPVVFTGSQNAADALEPDGPANLSRAIAVASSTDAVGRGVLLCFAGDILPVPGVRKAHTLDLRAFTNPDFGSLGVVVSGHEPVMAGSRRRMDPLPWPPANQAFPPRVDLVSVYPGADSLHLRSSVDAGAAGVVLQATGSGNANTQICRAIADATAAGVTVITSTRVHAGPVVPIYGTGGGKDLFEAGAIPAGLLKPSQSLILLTLLLRLGYTHEEIRRTFERRGSLTSADSDSISQLTRKVDS